MKAAFQSLKPADHIVIAGFVCLIAGIGVRFGAGWALIAAGGLLLFAGAKLQQGKAS